MDPTIACTLGPDDLGAQRERWLGLLDRAGAGREETDDGLVLRFRDEAGVADELEALAAVERECCSWATWTVERGSGLALHAASTGDGIAVLHGMLV